MTKFYTSDIHFGHINIMDYCNRPYRRVDKMDEDIVDRWNRTVGPDDEVMILGDLCMGQIEDSLKYANELNGVKKLLIGNHDRPFQTGSGAKHDFWVETYWKAGFECIEGNSRTIVGEKKVVLSHFPYQTKASDMELTRLHDSDREDRFADYRPKDTGEWLLHGHVHDMWRQFGRMINVGLDAWGGYPISEGTIEALISDGMNDLPIIPWTKQEETK